MESATREVLESCEKLHWKVLELVYNSSGQKKLREYATCRCAINRIQALMYIMCCTASCDLLQRAHELQNTVEKRMSEKWVNHLQLLL